MSADTPDVGLTEQQIAEWNQLADDLVSHGVGEEAQYGEVIAALLDSLAAERERADAAKAHVVHVTAEPVAEDVVWCESCEEWVTSGAPERAALGGEATP